MPMFNGFGLGLRPVHYQEIIDTLPASIDWFEIISEDFLTAGGKQFEYLDAIRTHYPMAMHGVGMSIGSTDPLDKAYLKDLKALMQRVQPMWISDHLCWTGVNRVNLHDLMPLPFTQECIDHLAERIKAVQDFLGTQILMENVSSYITYQYAEMTEWEFINAVTDATDCFVLLDVNNVYVNSFNHHFDPAEFINGINPQRVKQFHLAGHKNCMTHIIDTHDDSIIPEVWALYEQACQRFPNTPVLIERDSNIPPLNVLIEELECARAHYQQAMTGMAV